MNWCWDRKKIVNIKGFNLVLGFPNTKYPPTKKLPAVFINKGGDV